MARRALVVAPTPYYIEKGSTLRVHAMVQRLRRQGYLVDVVCYDRGTDPELDGVSISRAGIRSFTSTDAGPALTDLLNDVFVSIRVFRQVLTRNYDILQGEDVEGITIALAASICTDAETIYDLHNPLTESLDLHGIPIPHRLSRAVEGALYRRVDTILANWGMWADAIRSEYDVERVEVVHDQIPAEMSEIDLPTDRYLTYVGNFEPYQGVDLLVEAFEAVAAGTDVDLVLVGDPSVEIRDLVAGSPVADRIHLLGRQPIPTANFVIANAVASVIPRRHGTQPSTKLLHYAMHDPPIIATDLRCNQELERLGHEVYWAAPTAGGIATCIEEVANHG